MSSAELVEAVAVELATVPVPIVVDPVATSKHGDPLLAPDAVEVMRSSLLPVATVATPNLDEVRLLTGVNVVGPADLPRAAEALLSLGPRWALVKGGHLEGDAIDLLTDGSQMVELPASRQDNRHAHGTGDTLASAIAVGLARGLDMVAAVRMGKEFVTGAVAAGFAVGSGIGPVDHGWRWRAGRS